MRSLVFYSAVLLLALAGMDASVHAQGTPTSTTDLPSEGTGTGTFIPPTGTGPGTGSCFDVGCCCVSGCNAGGCFCDQECVGLGDCCDDFSDACGCSPTSTSSTTDLPSEGTGSGTTFIPSTSTTDLPTGTPDTGLDYEECCCNEYRAPGGLRYACCNNLADANTTCDGTDYGVQGMFDACGSGGVNLVDEEVDLSMFTCPGCAAQSACSDACDIQFPNASKPCWMWVRCFRSCCRRASLDPAAQISSASVAMVILNGEISFCGDGQCDASFGENPVSCSLDCCPFIDRLGCQILDRGLCGATGPPIQTCTKSGI